MHNNWAKILDQNTKLKAWCCLNAVFTQKKVKHSDWKNWKFSNLGKNVFNILFSTVASETGILDFRLQKHRTWNNNHWACCLQKANTTFQHQRLDEEENHRYYQILAAWPALGLALPARFSPRPQQLGPHSSPGWEQENPPYRRRNYAVGNQR